MRKAQAGGTGAQGRGLRAPPEAAPPAPPLAASAAPPPAGGRGRCPAGAASPYLPCWAGDSGRGGSGGLGAARRSRRCRAGGGGGGRMAADGGGGAAGCAAGAAPAPRRAPAPPERSTFKMAPGELGVTSPGGGAGGAGLRSGRGPRRPPRGRWDGGAAAPHPARRTARVSRLPRGSGPGSRPARQDALQTHPSLQSFTESRPGLSSLFGFGSFLHSLASSSCRFLTQQLLGGATEPVCCAFSTLLDVFHQPPSQISAENPSVAVRFSLLFPARTRPCS